MTGVLLEPGYAFRGGRIVSEGPRRTSPRSRSTAGKEAFSIGSSEHFALPWLAQRGQTAPSPAGR